VQQDLFFFHPLSPGCAFFLPLGGRIYNTLIDYMREKYWEYEYEEVREWREGGQHCRESTASLCIPRRLRQAAAFSRL
jgi:hypothetical protein